MTTTANTLPAADRRVRRRWLVIAPAIALAWAVANIEKVGLGQIVASPGFSTDLGLSKAQIGFLFTAFAVPYASFNLLWGYVIDRTGARRVVVVSAVLWSIAMAMAALAQDFSVLVASRALLGLAEGVLWSATARLLVDWFAPRERARAQMSYVYGQVGGPAVGAVLLGAVLATSGWRGAFALMAVLPLVVVVPLFVLLVRDRPAAGRDTAEAAAEVVELAESGDPVRSLRSVLTSRLVVALAIAFAANSVAFYGLSAWIPSYLTRQRGLSPGTMATFLSSAYLVAMVATAIGTWLADRRGRPSVIGAVGFAVAATGLVFGVSTHSAALAAPALMIGQGVSLMSLSMIGVLLQRGSPQSLIGRVVGSVSAFANIIGGTAATWLGWLIDASGGRYGLSIVVIGVILILGAVAMLTCLPYDRPSRPR